MPTLPRRAVVTPGFPSATRPERNSNPNGMSLKTARAILKGEKASFKREMAQLKLTQERLARAAGAPVAAESAEVNKATERVLNAYGYIEAALAVFEKQNPNKSALKEAARLGINLNAQEAAPVGTAQDEDMDEHNDSPRAPSSGCC